MKEIFVEGSEALWFGLDDSTAAGWVGQSAATLKCVRAVDSFKEVMGTEKNCLLLEYNSPLTEEPV